MRTATLILALLLLPTAATAQSWPSRPVRLVVPFAPGGPPDFVARLVGQRMSTEAGQPVIVENRSGADGNLGTASVAKGPADGYTALLTVPSILVNASLFASPGYDPARDFVPVAMIARIPSVIFVNERLAARSLGELIELAKGAKLAFASPGNGTTPTLSLQHLFNVVAKLDVPAVHFRGGGPAVAAVLNGEPPVGALGITAPLPHIKAGKLRALAVTGAERIAALPDVPTLSEAGFPGLQYHGWAALFAPAGTPPEAVRALNAAANRALQSPEVRERLAAQSMEPMGGNADEAAAFMKAELQRWSRVVKETGARAE